MASKLRGDTVPTVLPEYDDRGFMVSFQPHPVEVPCCGDVIWSATEGEYAACFCGKSAVDQTKFCSRSIGALAEKLIKDSRPVANKSEEQYDWINEEFEKV